MSTLKVTSLQHASAASAAITLASDGTATASLSSLNGGPLSGTRNRIINGDMRIDQRNAGASITATAAYTVDRWYARESGAGSASFQQVSDSPSAFSHSLKTTVTGTVSPLTAGDRLYVRQPIEGFNTSDLAFGTASAKTITISFWVKSSVTGQFGGAVTNSVIDRSYVFNFTVSTANTWEYKAVTIAGDTTGTWTGATNGIGLYLVLSMATGSTYESTAGSWQSGEYYNSSSSVNLLATSGATFYITGVQLEAGTVATPFERRSYGQELSLCQRYYYKSQPLSDVNSPTYSTELRGRIALNHPVTMRANPVVTATSWTMFGSLTGLNGYYDINSAAPRPEYQASAEL